MGRSVDNWIIPTC